MWQSTKGASILADVAESSRERTGQRGPFGHGTLSVTESFRFAG